MSASQETCRSVGLAVRYPRRAHHWRLRTRTLQLTRQPLLMGIVNVTPDSFSDGGKFHDPSRAVDHALQLADEGADLIDIGGESTRPYSQPVTVEQELERVLPVIEAVRCHSEIPVSVDTSKSKVAESALQAGAEVINDVTGLSGDPRMVEIARQSQAGICAMHMQGTPANMQDSPSYQNVVEDIYNYLEQRLSALIESGIQRDRICLDPGIGFGKTHQHNLTLVAECGRFHDLGQPVLVGHSRKGFLAKVLGDPEADRLAATVGIALVLATRGIQVIRVHDVKPVRDALRLFAAGGGIDGRTLNLETP